MQKRMEPSVKNWTAILIGAASLLAFMPDSADATGNRVWTLGGMNSFIEDDANRVLYPHTISKYSNLFYLELFGLGDSVGSVAPTSARTGANSAPHYTNDFSMLQSTAGGGAILKLMDGAFIALHLSDYQNSAVKSFLEDSFASFAGGDPSSFPWIGANPPQGLRAANRKLDLIGAYEAIPDFLTVGLSLSYGSSGYLYNPNDNDPPVFEGTDDEAARATDNVGTSEFRILASGGLELSDAITVELGLGFANHGLTYLPNNNNQLINGGSGTEVQFDARAMLGVTEMWELIPAISVRSLSFSATDYSNLGSGLSYNNVSPDRDQTNESSVTESSYSFDVGVAGHFKPSKFVDFWLATGVQFAKSEFSVIHLVPEDPNANPPIIRDTPLEESILTQGTNVLPYFKTGIEAKVFSWLDLRAGVVKYMVSNKTTVFQLDDQTNDNARNNDTTMDDPFFDYFLGLAAHYEGFFLDMQLDPEWIRRGPNFLSGASGNMFINGSLGYNF